ncbi:MAG: Crp/Fnr family transcriptional regulator [Hyphomonadaceae bacterium]|nr:Crp/Fnr family transcriptional regulator [Hyphomonadaceae bacterium]
MVEGLTSGQKRAKLRQVHILAAAKDADIDTLEETLTWRRVRGGDEVVSHLDRGKQVFFAVEGEFYAKLQTAFGREVAIRQLSAGSHFGEIAALTDTPRSVAIVADTDGLLAECPAEAFLALMARDGAFATAVAAHLARNVVQLTDRVFELAALETRFRVYAELLRLAASGEAVDRGILIRDAPTHETIAATIGAQREAVNRELRVLANAGLIEQGRRELLILDVDRLRDALRRRAGTTTSDAVDWRL